MCHALTRGLKQFSFKSSLVFCTDVDDGFFSSFFGLCVWGGGSFFTAIPARCTLPFDPSHRLFHKM